ncbi:3-oxo-tetronate kinase [Rhodococcus indonesiensis]
MLGGIADDFTGATDLATNLVTRGFRTTVTLGVPDGDLDDLRDHDAVVVALKSRTAPVAEAVADSRAALSVLRDLGADRIYDKYCSTFDSTPEGNIGPVADALMSELGVDTTVVVPSFPDNGRTVYQGHLFVGDRLLSDSSMRHHPLTPMRESDVVRLLAPQTTRPVGLVPHAVVRAGADAVRTELATRSGLQVIDAVDTTDLSVVAAATSHLPLVTGGSGLALGMQGPSDAAGARTVAVHRGFRAVLAGSASRTTQAQIAHARPHLTHLMLDAERLVDDRDDVLGQILDCATASWNRDPERPVMIYSVGEPADVATTTRSGHSSAALIEAALAELAVRFVDAGVRQLVVAGGETSGAVLRGLGAGRLRIGPQIAPGVAWAETRSGSIALDVALKSGNFGTTDMFTSAWDVLA